jgi:hypothetical protein
VDCPHAPDIVAGHIEVTGYLTIATFRPVATTIGASAFKLRNLRRMKLLDVPRQSGVTGYLLRGLSGSIAFPRQQLRIFRDLFRPLEREQLCPV